MMQLDVIKSAANRSRKADALLVEAIAQDLWSRRSGDGTLNWGAVERHLDGIVEQARIDAREIPGRPCLAGRGRAASDAPGGGSEAIRAR